MGPLCPGIGLSVTGGITLSDTTLAEKYPFMSEFKPFTEYSVLFQVKTDPVLGNKLEVG